MLRVRKEKQRQPLDDFLLALLADDLDGIVTGELRRGGEGGKRREKVKEVEVKKLRRAPCLFVPQFKWSCTLCLAPKYKNTPNYWQIWGDGGLSLILTGK